MGNPVAVRRCRANGDHHARELLKLDDNGRHRWGRRQWGQCGADDNRVSSGSGSFRRDARGQRALKAHKEADYGVVVTNNKYTLAAEQLASTNGVLLLHYSELQDLEDILQEKQVPVVILFVVNSRTVAGSHGPLCFT